MSGLRSFMECYEAVAANFDRDFGSIGRFVARCEPGPIVDLGAGIGRLLPLSSDRNPFICVERDAYGLARLREKSGRYPHVSVVEGNALSIPLADESVSGVILALSTHREIRPASFALAEVSRILRPGTGRVYFYVNNPKSNMIRFAARGPRTVTIDGETHAVHLDTYPTPSLGEHTFQTQWVVRTNNTEVTYAFNQVYPPLSFWQNVCETLGLTIESIEGDFEGGSFDPQSSIAMIISAVRKVDSVRTVGNELISRVYDNLAGDFEGFNQRNHYQAPTWVSEQAIRWCGRLPRVLDLGCGHGYVGRILVDAKAGGWVYGLDANQRLLELARESGAYRALIQSDLNAPIPVAEELCFDIVSLVGVSEFIENLDMLLQRVFKMLSLGGELWLTCEETVQDSPPSGQIDPVYGFPFFHHRRDVLEKTLERIGFSNLVIKNGPGYTRTKSGRVVPYLYISASRKKL